MSTTPQNIRADTIRRQVAQLETVFKKKQSRNFQLGYPVGMTLLVGSIALWIIFTGAVMMSRIGTLAGLLIGCLIFSIMVVCFRYVYKRWDQQSIHRIQETAHNMFDDQFPAAESETRRMAMDILHENVENYSLAQVLLKSGHHADASPPLQAQQF